MTCWSQNSDTSSSKDLSNYPGELKNPFKNKNKHIRIKGPTPNTKRTIFAVLGFVCFSTIGSIILDLNFFLDFFLGIPKNRLKETIVTVLIYNRRVIRKIHFISNGNIFYKPR